MTNKEKFADILADEIMELVENLDGAYTEGDIKLRAQSIATSYADALAALEAAVLHLEHFNHGIERGRPLTVCPDREMNIFNSVLTNTKGWKP